MVGLHVMDVLIRFIQYFQSVLLQPQSVVNISEGGGQVGDWGLGAEFIKMLDK